MSDLGGLVDVSGQKVRIAPESRLGLAQIDDIERRLSRHPFAPAASLPGSKRSFAVDRDAVEQPKFLWMIVDRKMPGAAVAEEGHRVLLPAHSESEFGARHHLAQLAHQRPALAFVHVFEAYREVRVDERRFAPGLGGANE